MKLKVCGMKYQDNILKVFPKPDYMGLYFMKISTLSNLSPKYQKHKKVGVFVVHPLIPSQTPLINLI